MPIYTCKYSHLPHPVTLFGWEWNLRDVWDRAAQGELILLSY